MAAPPLQPFQDRVTALGNPPWLSTASRLSTLQVNIGAKCNLQCKHCHIQAGPNRTEEMDRTVMEACLQVFARDGFSVLDITGGAPELNPDYRWFITQAAGLAHEVGGKVITRTNLVILDQDGYCDLPGLWAGLGVEVAASLPSWDERNTDRQRGAGVFRQAIEGLRLLNAVGYGQSVGHAAGYGQGEAHVAGVGYGCSEASAVGYGQSGASADGSDLIVNLVVNPGGAFLPPAQNSAEREYRKRLEDGYGVHFDGLLTITNNPVGRFGAFLEERGLYDAYLERLCDAFNPATMENMMCRSQISVAWDGRLFDCDFNQVLDWPLEEQPTIFAVAQQGVRPRKMRLGEHCYACCAGAGSSCGGATT